MATITKPIVLDETLKATNEILKQLLSNSDSQVYVSTDKGTTYTGPITPLAWASAIENEAYSVGTIFKITKVFNGKEMRFIAIGLNHDVLSNTDLGEL